MVAIVTGNGQGVERSSGFVLGSNGQLGSSTFGRYGENVTVNAANGNLVIGRTDEILIGQGPDSVISRAYNSEGGYSGLGTSDDWQLNDQRHVTNLTGTVNTSGSTITLSDWDGSNVVYIYNTIRSAYVSTEGAGAYNTLTYAPGTNRWTWTDGSTQATDIFDNANSGRIITSNDTNSNVLTYSYTGSQLTRVTVTDASGTTAEHTDLTWSGSNLTQLTTTLSSGTTLTRTRYTYDAQNRLSTVTTDLSPNDNSITDGNTVVTTYTYVNNTVGSAGFSQIASISQTGGAALNITYDTGNRVQTIKQTMATGVWNMSTFAYSTGSTAINVTTSSDSVGQTTTLAYDANNQLTGITLPAAQTGATAQTQSFTYDSNGNVSTTTDGSGNVTAYQYDSNGNVVQTRDQAGNTFERYYDSTNHLLTETTYSVPDPDGAGAGAASGPETTRYVYDTSGNLRFVVSALGEVTEYQYNNAGDTAEQTSSFVYRGNTYNISGLGTTTSIALSSMTSWTAGISDKSGVKRTDTAYDFRGNVSTVTAYSQANTGGAGLTTSPYTVVTYTYDQYGNLLTRQTSGVPNSEVYTYDGLGRMLSSTDLNGATSSIAFTDGVNKMVATLGNGQVQTSLYNLAGELVSYAQSGSGVTTATTSYAYDALGRLGMVTDANGNNTYYLYDNVGRKVADIAADGSITEYRYDQSDRLISTTTYATRSALTSLVAAGGTSDVALSSIRPAPSTADNWSWRIYDTANRLIETIDGDGDVCTYSYDGASNLVSTTEYTDKLPSATLSGLMTTAPTSLVLTGLTGPTTTRSFYDADNRLIGTLNADGYLTQIVYDEAGEKVATIAYANIVTASGDRASGSFATLLADVGSSTADEYTRYFYDGEGNLAYTLDSSLRPVQYVYDNAGHVLHTIDYAGSIASTSTYTASYIASQISSLGLASNANTRTSYSVYDNAGRVAFTIDANGGVVGYVYDATGELVKTTAYVTLDPVTSDQSLSTMNSWVSTHASDTGNRVTRSFYNVLGQVVYTVDGEGYVTENRYDADGHVTLTIRYPTNSYAVADSTTTANLAANFSSIPSTAVQTAFGYDVDGRVTDLTDGNGVITHTVYNALGRATDVTQAYGLSDAATTHYVYDVIGRVVSETDAYGTAEATTTTYAYDGKGEVTSKTDGRSYITTYTYDGIGQVVQTTTPIDGSTSAVVTNTYDAFGNVVQTNDANGNNSYYFYDSLNRLTYQIDGAGYVTQMTYGFGNEIASITRYATAVTGTITAGTLPTITTSSAHDEVTSFIRDNLGRVTKETDAQSYYDQYTLDAFGDQVAVRNKLGGITANTFDRRGLLLSETMAQNAYNAAGTLEASSVTNNYTYDSRGNRTQMIEAYGLSEARTTTYTYDKMNRLLTTTGDTLGAIIVPSVGSYTATWGVVPVTTNTYDDRGNLIETVDPTGAKTFLYYDHLSRQIATVNAVGTLSTSAYDANGNVISQRVYGDAVSLPSTAGGTPPSPVNSSNYRETDYTYDRANRLLTTTVANVSYGYYNGSSFVTGTTNLVTTNTYDKDGNITSQTDANGNTVYSFYDKRGDKIAQVDQSRYLTYYTLDAEGNTLKQESFAVALSTAPTTSSDPSALRSSVVGNANDRVTVFTYDRNNNLLTEQHQNVTYYTVNSSNGILSSSTGNVTVTYTYNGLGEIVTKTEATGDATSYTYDSFGRETNITAPSFTDYTGTSVTPTTAMYYDGLNHLTRAVVNSSLVTTNTYGPGGVLASSTDASGFTTSFWYDAAGRVTAEAYVVAKSDGSTVEYGKFTQHDALGRVVSQQAGTYSGSAWGFNDYTQTQYDTYGEVTATGANGLWQVTTSYDNAGRAWKTDAGNGVAQIYYHDQNGNQTAEVTSDGNALPSGYAWSLLTQSQVTSLEISGGAFGSVAVPGMVMTFKTYDARGQNTTTVEPLRHINAAGTNYTITKQQSYDAFGEVISQTDARGNVTNYTYNTIGKLVQTQNPTVSVTAENGAITSVQPLQTNYYDQSGRLVAVQDANGNITSRLLRAGSGYGGSDPSITKEFHPDSGVESYGYDAAGNQRTVTDELGNVTQMAYDAMNRLVQVTHPTRAAGTAGNTTGSAQTLIDYYTYDGLGERTDHWNNLYGGTIKDRTDYDSEGRVTQTVDMAGHTTTMSYNWLSSIATNIYGGGSLGTFGGWVENTTDPTGFTKSVTVDYFNRTITQTDFGGNTTASTYNLAGQLADQAITPGTPAEYINYLYYNTGALESIDDITHVTVQGATAHPVDGTHPTTTTNSLGIVSTYYANPIDNPGNGIDYDFEYQHGAETEYDVITNYYSIRTDTYTDIHRTSSFEYDVDGNRTYEGASLTTTDTNTTYYDDHTVDNPTYNYYETDLHEGVTHNAHTYPYTAPVYGYYTYYTYDFVDTAQEYSYSDSYGSTTTVWYWPETGYETVQNAPTYHTAYYWVEEGSYYSDGCGGGSYYDYGYGYYVAYQAADAPTYSVVPYTYYESSYSEPHVGYYVTTPHTGYGVVGYTTDYGTYYTDDSYSYNTYASSNGTSSAVTADNTSTSTTSPVTTTTVLENETVTYDAMNRVTSIHDGGYNNAAPTTINMEYDANGNVRRRDALYRTLDNSGNVATTNTEQDNWYKYDSMNRFVTTEGTFTGTRGSGTISRGANGTDLTYDLAGDRATATNTNADSSVTQEQYTYTADGFLALTKVSTNGGTARNLAAYGLDSMGRATSYNEYGNSGAPTTPTYTRTATYDAVSNVTHDNTTTVKSDGIYYTATDYSYVAQSGTASGVSTGAYMGVLVSSNTTSSHTPNGGSNITDPSSVTTNTYVMRDNAMLKTTNVVPSTGPTGTTSYYYDGLGDLKQVSINDGQPRTVNYVDNAMGEIVKRDVSYYAGGVAPHELHYYLEGMAIGDVTNNGTSNTDYVTSIAARAATTGTGPFRNGAASGTSYANFDQSYDPINGYDATGGLGSYIVQAGDTLQNIAQRLWGDAGLWYLIAQANGLGASSALQTGTSLVIPNNQIHNFHNNASTFKVYDPNAAIGDVSPTAPELPQQQQLIPDDTSWVAQVMAYLQSGEDADVQQMNTEVAAAYAQTQAAAATAQEAAAAQAAAAVATQASDQQAAAAGAAQAAASVPQNSWEEYQASSIGDPQTTYNRYLGLGWSPEQSLSFVRGGSYFAQLKTLGSWAQSHPLDYWDMPQGWEPTADDIQRHDVLADAVNHQYQNPDQIVGSEQYMGLATSDSIEGYDATYAGIGDQGSQFQTFQPDAWQQQQQENADTQQQVDSIDAEIRASSGSQLDPNNTSSASPTLTSDGGSDGSSDTASASDGTASNTPVPQLVQAPDITVPQIAPGDINRSLPDLSGGGGAVAYVPPSSGDGGPSSPQYVNQYVDQTGKVSLTQSNYSDGFLKWSGGDQPVGASGLSQSDPGGLTWGQKFALDRAGDTLFGLGEVNTIQDASLQRAEQVGTLAEKIGFARDVKTVSNLADEAQIVRGAGTSIGVASIGIDLIQLAAAKNTSEQANAGISGTLDMAALGLTIAGSSAAGPVGIIVGATNFAVSKYPGGYVGIYKDSSALTYQQHLDAQKLGGFAGMLTDPYNAFHS